MCCEVLQSSKNICFSYHFPLMQIGKIHHPTVVHIFRWHDLHVCCWCDIHKWGLLWVYFPQPYHDWDVVCRTWGGGGGGTFFSNQFRITYINFENALKSRNNHNVICYNFQLNTRLLPNIQLCEYDPDFHFGAQPHIRYIKYSVI